MKSDRNIHEFITDGAPSTVTAALFNLNQVQIQIYQYYQERMQSDLLNVADYDLLNWEREQCLSWCNQINEIQLNLADSHGKELTNNLLHSLKDIGKMYPKEFLKLASLLENSLKQLTQQLAKQQNINDKIYGMPNEKERLVQHPIKSTEDRKPGALASASANLYRIQEQIKFHYQKISAVLGNHNYKQLDQPNLAQINYDALMKERMKCLDWYDQINVIQSNLNKPTGKKSINNLVSSLKTNDHSYSEELSALSTTLQNRLAEINDALMKKQKTITPTLSTFSMFKEPEHIKSISVQQTKLQPKENIQNKENTVVSKRK